MASQRFEPDLSEWDAWHPAEVARRLAGVDVPWCVIAGWSLDLYRGGQTREHEDLEIAVPERDFPAIREALSEFELYAILDGQAGPIDDATLAESHQTWVRDAAGRWRLDVMREPWDGDTWVCRRDPAIRRPRSEVVAYTAGRDSVPAAGGRAPLQGQAHASEGSGGLRRRASAARTRAARVAE